MSAVEDRAERREFARRSWPVLGGDQALGGVAAGGRADLAEWPGHVLPGAAHIGVSQISSTATARDFADPYRKDGSVGSTTAGSRSHPSFSSLSRVIVTALAFASRPGSASYSDTQHRYMW